MQNNSITTERRATANIFYDKKQALVKKITLQICAD